jgi:hypothetical protein
MEESQFGLQNARTAVKAAAKEAATTISATCCLLHPWSEEFLPALSLRYIVERGRGHLASRTAPHDFLVSRQA